MPRLLLVLSLSVLFLISTVASTGTRIPAGRTECFSESVEAGGHFTATFIVVDGGEKDIDAYITTTTILSTKKDKGNAQSPHVYLSSDNHNVESREVQRWTKTTEGQYSYVAPTAKQSGHGLPTKVTVCFSNAMSRWTPKWVDFSLIVDKDLTGSAAGEVSSVESQLEHNLHEQGQRMFRVRNLMQKVVQQEEVHREKVESTNSWVMWGTVVNGGLLIVMSVFQFWYLKRFLSIRRSGGAF